MTRNNGMHETDQGEWCRAEDLEAKIDVYAKLVETLNSSGIELETQLAAANALLKKCSNQLELSELLARVDAHLAQRSGQ